MKNKSIHRLLDAIDEGLKTQSMLGCYQYGIALKVIEDIMMNKEGTIAQRCNDIQHKIFGEG